MKNVIYTYARALRVNQWTKNLVVFTAIIFSGQLFDVALFSSTLYAFGIFCVLSSTSYLLNDIIDYRYDQKHPVKRNRPIASGLISIPQATFLVFVLTIVSLLVSLSFSIPFFILALIFILLHFFYSLYLKKYPVIDIFSISFSFMLRTFAGELVSGYHIPVWLLLTIFFISLFMATIKRHAELVTQGTKARESLSEYKAHFLDFLTYTFAAITIIAYANFAYLPDSSYLERKCIVPIEQEGAKKKEKITPSCELNPIAQWVLATYGNVQGRKLLMITIPFVLYGIARYAQLLYESDQGERPEKIITTDKPLMITIFLWGLVVVTLLYVL